MEIWRVREEESWWRFGWRFKALCLFKWQTVWSINPWQSQFRKLVSVPQKCDAETANFMSTTSQMCVVLQFSINFLFLLGKFPDTCSSDELRRGESYHGEDTISAFQRQLEARFMTRLLNLNKLFVNNKNWARCITTHANEWPFNQSLLPCCEFQFRRIEFSCQLPRPLKSWPTSGVVQKLRLWYSKTVRVQTAELETSSH